MTYNQSGYEDPVNRSESIPPGWTEEEEAGFQTDMANEAAKEAAQAEKDTNSTEPTSEGVADLETLLEGKEQVFP